MNTTPDTTPAASQDLDLRTPLLRIWSARGRVFLSAVLAGLLGVAVAFALPRWYRATGVILPPQETDLGSNLGVMAAALSKLPALGEFGEYTTPIDIYKAILNSRTIRDELVDRFDLMRVYHQKSRERTRKALAKHTTIKMNPDGTITVSIEDRDADRATAMTAAMLEGLDRYNITKRNALGRRTRLFLQRRVHETDSLLKTSEAALRDYQEKHHAVAPMSMGSADVNAAADLMARKVQLEVRLGVLRGYLNPNNEQVVQTQRELTELEHQIATLPAIQTELARLIRDNKVQEQLFLLLTAELEEARVKELRDTPTVTVLDVPVKPERPSRPRKFYFGLVASSIALIASCVVVARRETPALNAKG